MNILDILITIIVVTILVTIVLGVITYIAYKLRLARRPSVSQDDGDGTWYFERHEPATVSQPERPGASTSGSS